MPRRKYWKKARPQVSQTTDENGKQHKVKLTTGENNPNILEGSTVPRTTSRPAEAPHFQGSSVQGSFNQAHPQFKDNSGRQCVANSCASILFDQIKPVCSWTTDDLDAVLTAGNDLYSLVRSNLTVPQVYLLISELPSVVNLFGATFSLRHGPSLAGVLFGDVNPEIECDFFMSLDSAVKRALSDFNFCFVTFEYSTFAILMRNQYFYVFDSHSRNSNGIQIPDGKSVVVKYGTIAEVRDHCRRLGVSVGASKSTQFEITGMTVTVVEEPHADLTQMEVPTHTEDVVVVGNSCPATFFFQLPNPDVCIYLCCKLGIFCDSTDDSSLTPGDVLGNPCKTYAVGTDGNCFFRAISYVISGTEKNHRKIRLCAVKHLEDNAEAFTPFLRQPFVSVSDYIRRSRMKVLNTWATEVEIFAVADMLETDIFTFSGRWLRYSQSHIHPDRRPTDRGIYLHHVHESHYDVVCCVRQTLETGKYCSGNCVNTEVSLQPNPQELDLGTSTLFRKRLSSITHTMESAHVKKACTGTLKRKQHRDYMRRKRESAGVNASTYALDETCREKTKEYSRRKYAEDMSHQESVKAYSKRKYAEDSNHQKSVKSYSRSKYTEDFSHQRSVKSYSGRKYAEDISHQTSVKSYSRRKYAEDISHQTSVKSYSRRKYAEDISHQTSVKSYSRRKYAEDTIHQRKVIDYNKSKYAEDEAFQRKLKAESKRKYAKDEAHKAAVKRRSKYKYKVSEIQRQKVKQRNAVISAQRKYDRSQMNCVIAAFKKKIKEAPDHICSVCHRRLFQKQVVICQPESYLNRGPAVTKVAKTCISSKYLHQCSHKCGAPCDAMNSASGKLWICFTCHRKLVSGKIPAEAAANNLHTETIPEELECLNTLEQHLIAKHIPFAKVTALPKGAQKGVHGPVVCVPSNIEKTVSSLPRSESEDQMIRVKLKRKLTYKGHYKYQFVNTGRIRKALGYLMENNKHYDDITFNNEWLNPLPADEDETLPELQETEPQTVDEDNFPDLAEPENQTEVDKTHVIDHGMYMDSCLQPVDIGQEILDQHFDRILCLAPAEGNDPVRILMDEVNEAKSFPVLFPRGSPTYHDDREARITIARYLHTRLLLADTRFARNTEYIFYAQYLSEVYQVLSSVSIALRKSFVKAVEGKITPENLTDRESLRKLLRCDSGYKFLKPIRGTPVFWQSAQKDLFAMLRQLGIPTWFCSFSAGDMRWTEIIECLLKEDGDSQTADDLDWAEKCKLLRQHPVTAARMFDHRFHCLLKNVILSDANPVGKVVDYFYRVEFQQRGSPHTHCLLWVENAPQLDRDSDDDVVAFIDQYVTCQVPSPDDEELHEIVTSVQRHSRNHSKSCRKKGTRCRFNYPRPPSTCTFISRQENTSSLKKGKDTPSLPEMQSGDLTIEEAKTILEKIWKALEETEHMYGSVEELFEAVGVNQELFQKAYDKLSKRSSVVLQRKMEDVWVNQYNADLLRCWNANMDIQFVLDAYSCIVYIISYISKAEREMGLLLEHAKKEALSGNEDAKQAMKKLGGVYLHSRELSAQEAVYRVCNLHLKECSRMVQFVPVGDNAVKMSRPLNQLKCKKGDDLDADDLWMSSIVDRYQNRPAIPEFETMCLATFCSEYRVLPKSEHPTEKSGQKSDVVFKLQNDLGYIRKRTRTKPGVIRYPRFSPSAQGAKYYQSMLQLFLPYRTDNQLKPKKFETYQDFYEAGAVKLTNTVQVVKDIVDRNKARFETNADEIERAEEVFEQCGPLEDAWAQICPETEAERQSCLDEAKEVNTDPPDQTDIPDLLDTEKRNHASEVRPCTISQEEAQPLLRSLNKKQKEVFYKIRDWCLRKVNKEDPEPFHVFVTGGAGTGKSHLIRCLQYEATRILSRCMPNPDDISVLLTAPTGIAAFNIKASTIHSTFSISVDSKLPYQPLGEEKLNSLRSQLSELLILIIDEISMVDHKLLAYIHGRLRQIKQCPDHSPFGKVCVIAVGDFYQLSPVKGKPLYSEIVGVDLWSDNFSLVELTEVMRQKDGAFAATLNRLRTKKKSEKINSADIDVLMQRETGEDMDAIHIFATNQQVDEYNVVKINSMSSDPVCIQAQDFFQDPKSGKLERRETQYINVFNTNLARRLTLCKGAKVLLTKNLDISDGLVNGVFGTVSHIDIQAGETFPSVVYVVFDSLHVGQKLQKQKSLPTTLPANSTPICPQEDRVNNSGGIRRQFPLKLSFACTVHKLQGVTLKEAVVSLNKIFTAGQAYVALSRVTSLQGLVIQDFKESVIYCNENVDAALLTMLPFISLKQTSEPTHDCKVLLHNVQGLNSHIEDIRVDERFLRADFICVTETWLTTADPQGESYLDGFLFHHKSRAQSYSSSDKMFVELRQQAHGGVGVFHKVDRHWELLNLDITNLECLVFHSAERNIVVAVIYRPLSYRLGVFRQHLGSLLTQLDKFPLTTIVMGDFNENVFRCSTIVGFMKEHGFKQCVTEATTEGGTLIDHVYVRRTERVDVQVLPTYFSYHEAVRICL